MGLITSTLRVLHPIRAAKRTVYRAVVPRPIRRAQVLGGAIRHPMSEVRYQAIGALDRAVTPRQRRRRRATVSHAPGLLSADGKWRWNVASGRWERVHKGTAKIAWGIILAGVAGTCGITAIDIANEGLISVNYAIGYAVAGGVVGLIGDLLVLAGAREKAGA